MPRRHVARDHALPDGFRPRTGLFVSDQRHGRRGPFAVTLLALFLQNRGDVSGEGNARRARILRKREVWDQQQGRDRSGTNHILHGVISQQQSSDCASQCQR